MKAPEIAIATQTFWAMPIYKKYHARIMADGFKPHFEAICEDVCKMRKKYGELPMVFLSKRRDNIDYWEPQYNGENPGSMIAIALSYRCMVDNGLIETLQIQEAWEKDDDGNRIGELFIVSWCNRYDQLSSSWEVQGRYLKPIIEKTDDFTVYNPMLWPWNTDEEICDRLCLEGDARTEMIRRLQDGFEHTKKYVASFVASVDGKDDTRY